VYFKGDAPSYGSEVFTNSVNVIVYRLAGSTGWPAVGELWCDRPTALWSGVTPTPPPPALEAKIGVYRPSSGLWAIRDTTRTYFGGSNDTPVYSDFDGDGVKDIAVFRPGSGLWAIQNITRVYFGSSTDESIPGDYNGDGTDDIAVLRRWIGNWTQAGRDQWFVKDVSRFDFGIGMGPAVPGDYDGDGFTDVGIFRPANGLWAIKEVSRVYFGSSSDMPVPGDYDGNGTCEFAVFEDCHFSAVHRISSIQCANRTFGSCKISHGECNINFLDLVVRKELFQFDVNKIVLCDDYQTGSVLIKTVYDTRSKRIIRG